MTNINNIMHGARKPDINSPVNADNLQKKS